MAQQYGFIGLAAAAAIVIAKTATAVVQVRQEKKTDEAEEKAAQAAATAMQAKEAQIISEEVLRQTESKARQSQANAQAIANELALREKLHSEMVAQEHATTGYVDQVRSQVGIDNDNMLDRLWSKQRSYAEETMETALKQEEEELGKETNYKQIALYSILGIAGVGALVYSKKKFK